VKMIIAIIENHYSDAISRALLSQNFRITRLASTGGFLREGATTLMVGVEDEQLEPALEIIRAETPPSEDPNKIQATIYVLNIKNFKRV
jgi:uncharacterized protein YaaQ